MVLVIRSPPARLDRLFRRLRRDQTIAAAADEITAAGFDQGFTHGKVV
jgi:hypothetical protein